VFRLTGATRGIGANLALALSKAGADLILVQRNNTNTTTLDLVKSSGGKADIVVCDLADKVAVGGLIGKVTGEMGRKLDIVVNCGMYFSYGRMDDD
jgi:2-deoxy-D-gluconate 3-dehydrogenase